MKLSANARSLCHLNHVICVFEDKNDGKKKEKDAKVHQSAKGQRKYCPGQKIAGKLLKEYFLPNLSLLPPFCPSGISNKNDRNYEINTEKNLRKEKHYFDQKQQENYLKNIFLLKIFPGEMKRMDKEQRPSP